MHSDNYMVRWFSNMREAEWIRDRRAPGVGRSDANVALTRLISYDHLLLTEDLDRGLPMLVRAAGWRDDTLPAVPHANVNMASGAENKTATVVPASLLPYNGHPYLLYDHELYAYAVKRYQTQLRSMGYGPTFPSPESI